MWIRNLTMGLLMGLCQVKMGQGSGLQEDMPEPRKAHQPAMLT